MLQNDSTPDQNWIWPTIKLGGTQIPQVQILVFESDSPQQHLLGFELSWGNYSHSGTNLYHLTFVRRSEGFQQTEANLIWPLKQKTSEMVH